MASIAKKISAAPKTTKSNINQTLQERQSSELVIAFCGPLGCGIKEIIPIITTALEAQGYHVEHIRISDLISKSINETPNLAPLSSYLPPAGSSKYIRYTKLQDTGDQFRKAVSNNVLAQLAIEDIGARRIEQHDGDEPSPAEKRTAYIVDQLKHPDEALLLRKVYGSIFYMAGVLSKESERILRLEREELIERPDANILIERDKQEDFTHGQKLEKTLQAADYFIKNDGGNTAAIEASLIRFINLIHGKNGITPTKNESGIYAAFSASLQSACLSRQVGAAICTKEGQLLSTGKNDVPASGGGLYTEDHGPNDHRCVHKGAKCYNDEYKNRLQREIEQILQKNDSIKSAETASELANKIAKNTQINSLIEYSRAIHAEMDAVVTLARNPSCSTQGTILYSTTYPCHNCARHIIAAGISKVIYIEPYEKSLAEKLHDDAITSHSEENKVSFEPFEGVAPRRYQVFFQSTSPRKVNGKALQIKTRETKNVDEEYIDSYTDKEKGVVSHLSTAINTAFNPHVIATD